MSYKDKNWQKRKKWFIQIILILYVKKSIQQIGLVIKPYAIAVVHIYWAGIGKRYQGSLNISADPNYWWRSIERRCHIWRVSNKVLIKVYQAVAPTKLVDLSICKPIE